MLVNLWPGNILLEQIYKDTGWCLENLVPKIFTNFWTKSSIVWDDCIRLLITSLMRSMKERSGDQVRKYRANLRKIHMQYVPCADWYYYVEKCSHTSMFS